nr:GGDEF domain-containing protein [Motiliproteus sediminis]
MEEQAQRVQSHLEEQRLRALSDPLTLLPNRAAYDERVQQEYARWARYAGELTMVVCDLDHFKKINDGYGHLAGDKVLRVVAKILTRSIRETDFVARYGGEEFVILMPETDTDRAQQVMDKLRQTVAKSPFNFKGEPVRVTMSFGISCFGPNDSAETVFERADKALYQAKGEGRNRCVVAA